MEFTILPARMEIEALEDIHLPAGAETNIFRGAFGMALRNVSCAPECAGVRECPCDRKCAYARVFEPVWDGGPSGYQDPPRPFVLRVAGQRGKVRAGERVQAGLFLFDTRMAGERDAWTELARAFDVAAAGRFRAFEGQGAASGIRAGLGG